MGCSRSPPKVFEVPFEHLGSKRNPAAGRDEGLLLLVAWDLPSETAVGLGECGLWAVPGLGERSLK